MLQGVTYLLTGESYFKLAPVKTIRYGLERVVCLEVRKVCNLILAKIEKQSSLPLLIFKNPAGIYLLKVNNRNTRARCEICSKLTIKTPERQWRRSGLFIVKTLNIFHILF